jgi:hypothetical protein
VSDTFEILYWRTKLLHHIKVVATDLLKHRNLRRKAETVERETGHRKTHNFATARCSLDVVHGVVTHLTRPIGVQREVRYNTVHHIRTTQAQQSPADHDDWHSTG